METNGNDAAYYRMREQHERDLADAAQLVEIRKIHLDMAEKYLSHAEEAERREAMD